MHPSGLKASYVLTASEARRATGALRKRYGFSMTFLPWITTFAALYSGINHHWSAWYYLFLPICSAILAVRFTLRALPVRAGVDTDLRFDDVGIRTERPRPASVAWRAVADTHDSGEFLILYLHGRPWPLPSERIVIPKRAFDDDGSAATRLLAEAPLRNSRSLA